MGLVIQTLKRNKRLFTLLEVLIGLFLLMIAGGFTSWKMYGGAKKKKFHSSVERIKARLIAAQKLSLSMQADWKVRFKRGKKGWVIEAGCEEIERKKLPPLKVDGLEIGFEGEMLDLYFYSTGYSFPEVTLVFYQDGEKESWTNRKSLTPPKGPKG